MNALTEEQMLLIQLMEECSELAQAAAKVLRFTKEDIRGKGYPPNIDGLRNEFIDLLGIASMLQDLNVLPRLNTEEVAYGVQAKRHKVEKYFQISDRLGTLDRPSLNRVVNEQGFHDLAERSYTN